MKTSNWSSIKMETVYLSDDDYEKAKLFNSKDAKLFWELALLPKNELLLLYMNGDKIQKRIIEKIKECKDNNLPFQIIKRQSELRELPLCESDIKEIDENDYI